MSCFVALYPHLGHGIDHLLLLLLVPLLSLDDFPELGRVSPVPTWQSLHELEIHSAGCAELTLLPRCCWLHQNSSILIDFQVVFSGNFLSIQHSLICLDHLHVIIDLKGNFPAQESENLGHQTPVTLF